MQGLSSYQACLVKPHGLPLNTQNRHIASSRTVSIHPEKQQRRSMRIVASAIRSTSSSSSSTSEDLRNWRALNLSDGSSGHVNESGIFESIFATFRLVPVIFYRALLVGGIGLSLASPAIAGQGFTQAASVQKAVDKATQKISRVDDTEENASVVKTSENDIDGNASESITQTNAVFSQIDANKRDMESTSIQGGFTDEFWNDIDLSKGSTESILKRILDDDPDNISALECLAKRLVEIDDSSHALVVIEKLLTLQPDEIEWKYMKAQTYDLDGQYELAKRGFEDILKIERFSSKALQGLVMAMDQLNQTADALKLVHERRIEAKQGNHVVEARNMGMLIGQFHTLKGNFQEALKLYKEMLEDDPTDFRPYLCQGIIYSVLGEKCTAEENFNQFEKLCPEDLPDRKFLEGIMSRAKREGQKIYDLKHKRKVRSATKGKK